MQSKGLDMCAIEGGPGIWWGRGEFLDSVKWQETLEIVLSEKNTPVANCKLNIFKTTTAFHNLVLISLYVFSRKKKNGISYDLLHSLYSSFSKFVR